MPCAQNVTHCDIKPFFNTSSIIHPPFLFTTPSQGFRGKIGIGCHDGHRVKPRSRRCDAGGSLGWAVVRSFVSSRSHTGFEMGLSSLGGCGVWTPSHDGFFGR